MVVVAVLGQTGCVEDGPPTTVETETRDQRSLAAGSQLLFVVGSATLSAGDAAIQARLLAKQVTVIVRTATAAQTSDANGKAFVIISDSVNSADVNTKFRDVVVPVMCMENALFDDMRMTGTTSGTDFGTAANQTALSLPPAANTTVVTAPQSFAWGVPSSAAVKIATLSGDANRAAVFSYTSGATMVGGSAPGRRLGFFATGSTATTLTAAGWKLFDDAVQWLVPGCSSSAQCPVPTNGTATCVGSLCGVACNAGSRLCGGSCVPTNSVSSCGSACVACPATPNGTPTCNGSVCGFTCNAGAHLCGGFCASNSSVNSCGSSCAVCPTPPNGTATCNGSVCGVACNAGSHLCGGSCAPNTSVSACGPSCVACPAIPNGTPTCNGSACGFTCNAGSHLCGGSCVSNTSVSACGSSCVACPATANGTATCNGSACGFTCNAGFKVCGGLCVPSTNAC